MSRGEIIHDTKRSRLGRGRWPRLLGRLTPIACLALLATTAVAREPALLPAPGGLRVAAVAETEIALSWSAPSGVNRVTGFKVTCEAGEFTVNAAECRLRDLVPGTTYRIAVRSRDDRGGWSTSCPPVIVTTKPDHTAPSVPTGLKAEAVGETRFTLTWHPAKDNVRVVAYEVFQDGKSLGVQREVECTVRKLVPGPTYRLAVRAGDAAGNWSSLSEPLLVTTDPDRRRPTPPSGLVASSVEPTRFQLSWRPSTDNVGVTGYEVRSNGVSAGTTTTSTIEVTGLRPDTSYGLVVRARDAAGNWSTDSAALAVRTSHTDQTPPSVPTQLRAEAAAATAFTLAWDESTDDAGPVLYEIVCDGKTVGRTSALRQEFHDLVPGVAYHYAVRAGDGAGNWSALSTELSVTLGGIDDSVGFEAEEGFAPGAVDGQLGWTAAAGAIIVADPVRTGGQSLRVAASAATREFQIPDSGITFTDVFARPAAAADALHGVFLETEAAAVALVAKDGRGEIYVCDGNGAGGGTWSGTGVTAALASTGQTQDWLRVTLRTDHSSERWDISVDGRLVAVDLGAIRAAGEGSEIVTLSCGSSAGAVFDDLLVAPDNPVFADADLDGMDDAWETAQGLDPQHNDRDGDPDGDGIKNIREFLIGSNPRSADSDGDGLTDGVEWQLGSSPADSDTDGDGLSDGWERSHGLDPLSSVDGSRDDDGDGVSNATEVQAGTNPFDFFNGRAVYTAPAELQGPTTYAYDHSGRMTRATYPAGRVVRYERDAAGNLSSISATDEGPIAEWRRQHGLPADGSGAGSDDAILAGDGLTNFEKYAFGLDPRVRFDGEMPAINRIVADGVAWLAVVYSRPAPVPLDVDYAVETSADGLGWSRVGDGALNSVTTATPDLARVEVRLPAPASGAGAWRVRLNLKRKFLP
ncbi:MAG TPA: fibronectin type III domain-containing protein [Opitutaceae bacterium]|nr:fibronectin type III domain-containing protein [Opitutaceae bacterium]